MEKAVAVIDIGMTNKKVAIYDRGLRMLDSVSRKFEPIPVDGIETHDLEGMETWFLERLSDFGKAYPIGAIAVTTHGATMVCIGDDGEPCAPCVYYTYEPGDEFQERFYRLVGERRELQSTTGTPPLSAMINPSKGLFFLKERFPEAFARTRVLLNFPQYWGYRLTGKTGAEGTYAGCHTYLWDWKAERYSTVADKLGIANMMPFPLRDSWDVLGAIKPELAKRTGLAPETVVTMGIHDSNASLLPHLAKKKGVDFILNSTGTWCVLMHPQEKFGFSPDELGKVVFFNRSAYNKPVKTAIFLGGMEFEAWTKVIAAACGCDPSPSALTDPGPDVYRSIVASASEFILPELVPGSGQFPGSRPRAVQDGRDYTLAEIESGGGLPAFMRDGKRALAVLNISLALQTRVALERTGLSPGTEVFTEGGFRKNGGYNAVLASALGGGVFLTDISEATALGAAMTAAAALEGTQPNALGDRFDVDYKAVRPMEGFSSKDGFGDLEKYRAAWLALVAAGPAIGSNGGKE
jgi:sugar (pentulose or hexulose) kinase